MTLCAREDRLLRLLDIPVAKYLTASAAHSMKLYPDKLLLSPTDLSNSLSCRHLVSLDLAATRGGKERPVRHNPLIEELRARGHSHERAYLERLREQGRTIAGDSNAREADKPSNMSIEETLDAMQSGADIVYQATLEDEAWSGRVDFLCRIDAASALGNWSYEVLDTKLARETKAETILQLCVYSNLLGKIQGVQPDRMHVVTPGTNFEPVSYRVDEYAAYFRLLERGISEFVAAPDATYPDLVSHCDYCAWWSDCEERRRGDDYLCYVAGISKTQMKCLHSFGVERLADLVALDPIPEPPQGSREVLVRVREQARMQHAARESGVPRFEFREPFDAEHGLSLLPDPSPDDIFLDFEGDHFAESGVQEYLLGYATREPEGDARYTALWARTLEEERAAFERFIDLAAETRRRNPRAHIYHYAPYEPAALKRLMGRYATREVELDELLRARSFVDLHTVVKRALVAGVERYSIKNLEPFFGYSRGQDLREATSSRRIVENAIAERDPDEALLPHFSAVEAYNREDCESAERLRDWLEELRTDVISRGHELPRPEFHSGDASEAISGLDQELERLRNGLLEGVPLNPDDRSDTDHARFALAHMMEFHRREEKASWWEYFRLLELEESELEDERRALRGLEHAETIEPRAAPLERYCFPSQDLDARSGDTVYSVDGTRVGAVDDVNLSECSIDIKKSKAAAGFHPSAVVLHNQVSSKVLRESLMRLGEAVLANEFALQAPYRAALELLLRRPPPTDPPNGPLQCAGETTIEAACRIAVQLDGNVLAIQGPPGTGKTYTGAQIVCALVRAGLKVGVTAVSHKVVVNLLEATSKQAKEDGLNMSLVHRQQGQYDGEWGIQRISDYGDIRARLGNATVNVLGATAWCWARHEFEQSVDVLIVDEAGQMSLANVLACAPAARSLVLLGDPQQLEQPLQSSHPEGSEVSTLYHLLNGADTMPPNQGLFLGQTYRLHPDIARFTSEIYYEGRVESRLGLERQSILPRGVDEADLMGSGLRYLPVDHDGNQARSPEEIKCVKRLVIELLEHSSWQDQDGKVRPLTPNDILIVAPYNAQVSALVDALPDLSDRIGTVDRFQGQEAPVVIYSMTSSSPEDAPRGMEFLYNRFRFNVATSRARALCILVGSPALFQPECRTPRQMRMANGLCRYRELASTLQLT